MKHVISLFLLSLLTLSFSACSTTDEKPVRKGRLMVPSFIECDRNNLTSWHGEVKHYSRNSEFISMTVATDYGTTEALTFNLNEEGDHIKNMFLANTRFSTQSWSQIESTPNSVNTNVRVVVWVCSTDNLGGDGRYVIQWQLSD